MSILALDGTTEVVLSEQPVRSRLGLAARTWPRGASKPQLNFFVETWEWRWRGTGEAKRDCAFQAGTRTRTHSRCQSESMSVYVGGQVLVGSRGERLAQALVLTPILPS